MNQGTLFKQNLPTDNNETLTEPIFYSINKYQAGLSQKKEDSAFIHVDEIASKVAKLYEKVRKIIDWKEENLLRRNAIERILQRGLISEVSNFNFVKIKPDVVAESLVHELIRGGHLPNDEIPETKISSVSQILKKYIFVLQKAPFDSNSNFPLKSRINLFNWIWEIAACEIEETLAPPVKEEALIEAMTLLMVERIKIVPREAVSEEERNILTYIAVHRTLFDLDDAIISYHLLIQKYQPWKNPTEAFWQNITQNILTIKESLQKELNHPLSKDFFNICERTDSSFTLLGDIFDEYRAEPEKLLPAVIDKENFKNLLTSYYQKRLKSLKGRLFKIAIFSTLSVFVSNWFTFFIVEIPLAHLFYEGFSPLAAIVDFVVPSLAMFALVAIIKPPAPSNLPKVIEMTSRFIYKNERKELYEIKPKSKRGWLSLIILSLLYSFGCLISFGSIAWAFYKATLPITSVIFDTLTIALNVFAALVVRNKSKEITVEEKSSFWEFVIDVLSLPVAEIGSWIANKWKEYNLASVFFNVFIEIPFVSFISFIENWRGFLKERKASIH